MISLQPWRYIQKTTKQKKNIQNQHFSCSHFWTSTGFMHQVAADVSRAVTRFTTLIDRFPRGIHLSFASPSVGRTWRNPGMSLCTKGRSHWASPSSAARMEASLSPRSPKGASRTRRDWSTGTNYWRYEPHHCHQVIDGTPLSAHGSGMHKSVVMSQKTHQHCYFYFC